jgi:hypothetical protein
MDLVHTHTVVWYDRYGNEIGWDNGVIMEICIRVQQLIRDGSVAKIVIERNYKTVKEEEEETDQLIEELDSAFKNMEKEGKKEVK